MENEQAMSIDTLTKKLESQKTAIWWLKFLVIILLALVAYLWILPATEMCLNRNRVETLEKKQCRTIEEAVEMQWRTQNSPPGLFVNWDRPSWKYYLQLRNKKSVDRWASIELAMIYKPDGKSSLSEFYLLKRDDSNCWNVLYHTFKVPGIEEIAQDIPEDTLQKLGWRHGGGP
ncbi:MAG: hypothetical protein AB9903_31610 [Vulcanimicrobiota bacterium]